MVLLISILVNTSACYGKVHVTSVNVCIQRCVEPHRTIKLLTLPLTALCNSDGEKSWHPSGWYLTLCYLSLTCSNSLNSLNKSACLPAEIGVSAPANRPRYVKKAEARSEIWKYLAYVADSKGKPTDTTRPVCKWWFKSVMTEGSNTSV